jgi:hypothetical protein
MIVNTRYHVIGLDPVQQLALRFLLKNAYSAWIDKVINEAKSFDEEERQEKSSYTFKLFDRYNEITSLLTTKDGLKKAKGTALILSVEGMSFIKIATKAFDEKNSYLNSKEIEVIRRVYEPLKQKVEDTSQFTYTKEEIEKAQKE